jgi:hypothetical protein
MQQQRKSCQFTKSLLQRIQGVPHGEALLYNFCAQSGQEKSTLVNVFGIFKYGVLRSIILSTQLT